MARPTKKSTGVFQYPATKAWGVDYRDEHGKRVRKQIGTRDDALAYYAEIQRRLRVGEVLPEKKTRTKMTIGQLADRVIARTSNKDSVRETEAWKETNGKLYPSDLTSLGIREWVDKARATYKAGTILRKIAALQAIFTEAVHLGELLHRDNPFSDRKSLRLPKPKERVRYLSPEEEELLVARMGDWWDYAIFGVLTGLRWADQADLEWDRVDLVRAYVVLPDPKNEHQQVLPLNSDAVAVLRRQRNRFPGSQFCFPGTGGGRLSQSYWGKKWRSWLRPKDESEPPIQNFRWHDLRHTCASRLRQAGVALGHISVILNHRDPRTTLRYAHLGESDVRASMDKLNQDGHNLDAKQSKRKRKAL